MSILSKYGSIIAAFLILLLATGAYGLYQENRRLTHELDSSLAVIRQYQQAQAMAEAAAQKLAEHKEATHHEATRQQQMVNDVLTNNKDWTDTFLPDDILRMFNQATTGPGDVPPTSGAAQ